MDALDLINYTQRKADWAKLAFSGKADSGQDWLLYNPEFKWCKLHKRCVPVYVDFIDDQRFQDCRVCLQSESQMPRCPSDLTSAKEHWRHNFALKQREGALISHSLSAGNEKATYDKIVESEWWAWIAYEVACQRLGDELKHRKPSDAESRLLAQKQVDSEERNPLNTDKTFCEQHGEIGDAWPWRRCRSRYSSCLICVQPLPKQAAMGNLSMARALVENS